MVLAMWVGVIFLRAFDVMACESLTKSHNDCASPQLGKALGGNLPSPESNRDSVAKIQVCELQSSLSPRHDERRSLPRGAKTVRYAAADTKPLRMAKRTNPGT